MSGARPQRDAVVTLKVPFTVHKRGGRKLVLAPDGAPVPPAAPQVDNTLVKALARAFRWRKMLEAGRYATIREIAKAEKINPSYVSRVLRLTLLAPATVEAILDGRQPVETTLAGLMRPFAQDWSEQATIPPAKLCRLFDLRQQLLVHRPRHVGQDARPIHSRPLAPHRSWATAS